MKIKNKLFLAPMAGITDKTFRLLCKEKGADVMYTEMVSAKGLMYENEKTKQLLEFEEKEREIGVQIFGNDPKNLSEIAKEVEKKEFDFINLNVGCPAPKITKNGYGSALMKTPELLGEIIREVKNTVNIPFSVKIRKGFEQENAVEIAKIAEKNGADFITVHGRLRSDFYSGKVDLDVIKKVKEAVNIPVIGNGDIKNGRDVLKMIEYTNCDSVMIGRGAQGNPWIFNEIKHYLKTGEELPKPSIDEKKEMIIRHAKMLIKHKGENIGMKEMRKHISWYVKGMKNATEVRRRLNEIKDLKSLKTILNIIEG